MEKRLILITSPPACGKTRLAKRLSAELNNVVYLDKDTLIPLSKQIFKVAHKPYNRSSAFFQKNIRDYEYEVILNLGYEAIKYADSVIINAPFRREVRDKGYLEGLRNRFAKLNAKIFIIWISATPELAYKRMKKRNSDRDKWKLENWDEYVKTVDFSPPDEIEDLFIFKNSTDEESNESFERLLNHLKDE
ncbi:MAG: ATP-binding protein [Clostridiales bacterium]|nr:ATP-binding protein [Clostridiales bacterium]